jgi:hypothetical protein
MPAAGHGRNCVCPQCHDDGRPTGEVHTLAMRRAWREQAVRDSEPPPPVDRSTVADRQANAARQRRNHR